MRTLISRVAATVALAAFAVGFLSAGCSRDAANAPRDGGSLEVSILQRPVVGKLTVGEDELAYTGSAEVQSDRDVVVDLGDDTIGSSMIEIPTDAIDELPPGLRVAMVKMKVNRLGEVSADLGPNGLKFKKPVWLTLSYRGADLNGIDESTLAIFYLNEDLAEPVWELVEGSVVDTELDAVRAPLSHFSRYAIGSDQ